MSSIILIDETGLASDKTSDKASLKGNRKEKFCGQLEWSGATGTLTGTFDLKYALTKTAAPTSKTADQIAINAATGSAVFLIDPHELEYFQGFYVKNGITSIDIKVTISREVAGIS